ncbi:methyltransferase domain-containing protein [Actinoplanes sp. NPDC051851]|uniref:methyltransferase domain-containing protein n=1 Tax=Actinoplanes sp. NPDC051851 TaxID=3154753 RepID=UPI00342CDBF8
MWDPAVYRRYGTERSRPFFDLVGRITTETPRAVVDLGCGPGELTRTLAGRWPGARITGIDSSPEMIEKASAEPGPVAFRLGDVNDWRPEPETDVVVTNAVLQWVPDHPALLVRWISSLPAGATLAMQVPGNFRNPGHRAVWDLAEGPLREELREDPVDDAAGYADLLLGAGATVDAWETEYVHLLPVEGPDHPVLRWMEGTALRPVRAALGDEEWTAFRAELAVRLTDAYPERHGLVAFPFRRIFVVASV